MERVRVFTRADGYSEKDLLHFAYDHIASANILFKEGPSCYDSAAFLGHLGIELLLQALLLHRADDFPATHDLAKLRRLMAEAAPEVVFTDKGRSLLSRIDDFFSLRYPVPGGSEPVGTEDLTPLLTLTRGLVDAFPPELRQEFATKLKKGGRVLMRKPIDPNDTD